MSELAHYLSVTPSSLQRELQRLSEAGILRQRLDGNRIYYRCNEDCPFISELQGLLIKTVGVLGLLEQALKPFLKVIDVAFVFGSFAQSSELVTSDIDLMIVGSVGLAELAVPIRRIEKRLNRPINPVILSSVEARAKLDSAHHFLASVQQAKKYFLWGKHSELGRAFSREEDQNAQDERV
jgi:predicted nucleotidyltransferase